MMNEYDLRRYALILAVEAEIKGMEADNKQASLCDQDIPYRDKEFCDKALELKDLAYKHNDLL